MKTQERQEGRWVKEAGWGQPKHCVAKDYLAFVYVVERTGQPSWGRGLCRTTFMSMPPLQSRRVTLALGFMLCCHAPEIHIHFEEGAPFVHLQFTLQMMWPLLSFSPCSRPMAACQLRRLQNRRAGW